MRVPYHLFRISTWRSEPLLAAMAAIAVGMFLGAWFLGPMLSHNNSDVPGSTARERMNYEQMVARPDPPPFRSPTPTFDSSNAPDYAAAARAQAQGQMSDLPNGDATATIPHGSGPARSRAQRFDRHGVIY